MFYHEKGVVSNWKVSVLPQKRGLFSNWRIRMGTTFSSEWGSQSLCVQNVAAKLVAGGRKYDHVTHILRELHWLPMVNKCTWLACKTVNGYAPQYFQDRIAFQEHRSLQSKDKHLLKVHKTKLVTEQDRSFSQYVPILGSNLSHSMKGTKCQELFKSTLKTKLFSEAYH